eukprot:tig00000473_g1220.t1
MPRFVFVKKQVVQAPQYGVEPISLTVGRPQVRSGSVLNNGNSTYGFQLNWVAVTNAVKYKVYRATSINGPWDLVATPVVLEWSVPVTGVTVSYNIYRGGVFLASDTSSPFSDTTTVYGTTYTYTIKGVNQIGEEGPQSSSASATTANAPVLGTFSYTGADQTFVVPTGTVAVRVIVWAAGVEAENAQVRGSVEARVLA